MPGEMRFRMDKGAMLGLVPLVVFLVLALASFAARWAKGGQPQPYVGTLFDIKRAKIILNHGGASGGVDDMGAGYLRLYSTDHKSGRTYSCFVAPGQNPPPVFWWPPREPSGVHVWWIQAQAIDPSNPYAPPCEFVRQPY